MRCRQSRSADIRWDALIPRVTLSCAERCRSSRFSSMIDLHGTGLDRFWAGKPSFGLATRQRRAYGGAAMPAHPFDLTGKVTLITGANSGLGFGFADAIARAGS